MEISGKTSIIDSDFRAGAIFYSLTNVLLFSFALTNTVIYAKLVEKHSKLDGVNPLAMTVISGIVTVISAALVIYSLYKLITVKEKRDKIERELHMTVPEEDRTLNIQEPEFKSVRDITRGSSSKGPSPFSRVTNRAPIPVSNLSANNFF